MFTAALGLALIVAGAVVFAAANRSPADVGWTSDAPLGPGVGGAYRSELTPAYGASWTVLWTGGHLTGAFLVVLGLLASPRWAAGCSAGGRQAPRTGRWADGVSLVGVSSRRVHSFCPRDVDGLCGTESHGSWSDLR